MLSVRECQWQSSYIGRAAPESSLAGWLVGTAASGLDLAADLAVRLGQDQVDTAGYYLLQSTVLPTTRLRPQNRHALAILQAWLDEPDDLGDDWWDAFERDLEKHRFSVRSAE